MEIVKSSKSVAGAAVTNGDDPECKTITNGLRTIGWFYYSFFLLKFKTNGVEV